MILFPSPHKLCAMVSRKNSLEVETRSSRTYRTKIAESTPSSAPLSGYSFSVVGIVVLLLSHSSRVHKEESSKLKIQFVTEITKTTGHSLGPSTFFETDNSYVVIWILHYHFQVAHRNFEHSAFPTLSREWTNICTKSLDFYLQVFSK